MMVRNLGGVPSIWLSRISLQVFLAVRPQYSEISQLPAWSDQTASYFLRHSDIPVTSISLSLTPPSSHPNQNVRSPGPLSTLTTQTIFTMDTTSSLIYVYVAPCRVLALAFLLSASTPSWFIVAPRFASYASFPTSMCTTTASPAPRTWNDDSHMTRYDLYIPV